MSTGLVLALKLDHLRKLEENSSTLKPPPTPPPRYLNSGAKITATTTTTKTAWTWILTDFGNGIHYYLQVKRLKAVLNGWSWKVSDVTICIPLHPPDKSWQRRCRWMRKRSLWPKGEGGEDHKHPGFPEKVMQKRWWCFKDFGANVRKFSRSKVKVWRMCLGEKNMPIK